MNEVRRQMIVYEREGHLLKWYDRMIPPGEQWKDTIDIRLKNAKIILLFLSPHFIESRYCYEIEGKQALEKNANGEAIVIPVILRPCAWTASPYGKLQALPTDGKPISTWHDIDLASLGVAESIFKIVKELKINDFKNKKSF
ncbi:TIR domain-containing protein [Thiothrix caldifontis]|uniref:TIR domain-containing protein n=2 Tax=Thiothrix caldifontis TaxID=525918 RepID=A0A1H3XPS2_9GAMM|nr:TIR domain-containing protein [Thiothrix caldifontis]